MKKIFIEELDCSSMLSVKSIRKKENTEEGLLHRCFSLAHGGLPIERAISRRKR